MYYYYALVKSTLSLISVVMSLIYFRECIVPEVSRAVLTTKSQFWDVAGLEGKLGGSHALNTQQGVKIKDVDK